MDFLKIRTQATKKNKFLVCPEFVIKASSDILIQGKKFFAIWDEENGIWSKDEFRAIELIDQELLKKKRDILQESDADVDVSWVHLSSSLGCRNFKQFLSASPDSFVEFDSKLTFANDVRTKKDYFTKRLGYSLEEGSIDCYDRMMSVLYSDTERRKFEWAIGSIIAGDSKRIQKFFTFFGDSGTGKSTVLNIIQMLFDGYYTVFDGKALTSGQPGSFATEAFKHNPLVAIQHDGDLSNVRDNSLFNSITSHEEIVVNEKYKSAHAQRINCLLFMATNKPVKITDAKSGLMRRLIDIRPTGNLIPTDEFDNLMDGIRMELGAIAKHCLEVYRYWGLNYYYHYRPLDMMEQTDHFFNFVVDSRDILAKEDPVQLSIAFRMYKEYCEDSLIEYRLPKYKFKQELKSYFKDFREVTQVDGKRRRNVYIGFRNPENIVFEKDDKEIPKESWLELKKQESLFDIQFAECFAQLANKDGVPPKPWDKSQVRLKDIETHKLHYVRLPENHIVIDFDIKNEKGEKDFEKNKAAVERWPKTYAETSKSGAGVHLHYIFAGDTSSISSQIPDLEDVEVKIFKGKASLRRKLSLCNDIAITTLTSWPFEEEVKRKMINQEGFRNEMILRKQIEKCLRKEVHAHTKPNVDFIFKLLNDAYNSGQHYDVRDLQGKVLTFAMRSSHQADYCLNLVNKMKFNSEDCSPPTEEYKSDELVIFDLEVFPNLLLIKWKFLGPDREIVTMINPKPSEVEEFIKFKLVGFNNRRYDNHILYGALLGYSNEELFKLSQRLINDKRGFFEEAYNISYTDIYDFASAGNKKSLKKFEVELGIHHQELALPWDQPVPEEKWEEVSDYCNNDILATEAVFNHLKGDWTARQILAKLSGLTVNDTTNTHSTKIIFGNNRHPQSEFNIPDLSKTFPGYRFERGKSFYRGEEVGEGGFVHAEPGMYFDVALLDIESMHPTSLIEMNMFGDAYTARFAALKQARVYIKHKEYNKLSEVLNGALSGFVDDIADGKINAKDLSNALKTVINSVYGLTAANFDNPFRDKRNIDNVVAKRGALFMIDLKNALQERGLTVAHIKTDSVKIPNATADDIQFVMDFGKKYGYKFEHEATYDCMCLVNDAVYIAKYADSEDGVKGEWTATGAQFAHPYIFKTMFSKEPIKFEDLCEMKSVKSTIYLDMNEGLGENEHNIVFVGRTGLFSPVVEGAGGGILLRTQDEKYVSVTGTKGYRWMESEILKQKENWEAIIDYSYFENLREKAIEAINKYGSYDILVSEPVMGPDDLPF